MEHRRLIRRNYNIIKRKWIGPNMSVFMVLLRAFWEHFCVRKCTEGIQDKSDFLIFTYTNFIDILPSAQTTTINDNKSAVQVSAVASYCHALSSAPATPPSCHAPSTMDAPRNPQHSHSHTHTRVWWHFRCSLEERETPGKRVKPNVLLA